MKDEISYVKTEVMISVCYRRILNETILRLKPVINMPSGSNIDDLKKKDLGEAVYVLPKEYFSPKVFDSREVFLTPETHAIHHYQTHGFRIRLSPTTVHGHYSSRYSDTRP